MYRFSTIEDPIFVLGAAPPGRADTTSERLEEHLQSTVKRLKQLGIRPGVCIASALPDGPDSITAEWTATRVQANFAPLSPWISLEQYQSLLLKTEAKLLLLHSGPHPAREAARSLGIPVANVLRHFEAGIFTLEADVAPAWTVEPPPPPAWKKRPSGVPVVLIAPGPAYRGLANWLDATNPVVGITPPSLDQLPLPHTVEHIAAECVRILRRYRPQGPYALAGWRIDSLVALEMARLLENGGEKVPFVAMLDASSLFHQPESFLRRAAKLFRPKSAPPDDFMTGALRQYRPRPWFGKILHLSPSEAKRNRSHAQLDWRSIAPHGFASYEAPSEMLAEPNVQIVATILAAELVLARS